MFESVLILLFFVVFVYRKIFYVKVSVAKNVLKRKYEFDVLDLADEPLTKRPRLEGLKVMRVFPYFHNEQLANQTENSDSDDETVLSETTVDASEYFGRDSQQRVLVSTQTVHSNSSSEGEYDLDDRMSFLSEMSLSPSTLSDSTLEFNEENLNALGFSSSIHALSKF